jgi:hypothetical protein
LGNKPIIPIIIHATLKGRSERLYVLDQTVSYLRIG